MIQTAADLLAGVVEDVESGKPPPRFKVGNSGFDSVWVGPGLVTLIGGPPGAGKTALAMQWVTDGAILNPDMRVLVANVEMPPARLLQRTLARVGGVDLARIAARKLTTEDKAKLAKARADLAEPLKRLAFADHPHDTVKVGEQARAFGANCLVLDYIQRMRIGGAKGDKRSEVNELMQDVRLVASKGAAVIALAAVSRTLDKRGRSSYGGDFLSLASFRESGELEYGADDAFVLSADNPDMPKLAHLKSRYGETADLYLKFDRPRQSFTVGGTGIAGQFDATKVTK